MRRRVFIGLMGVATVWPLVGSVLSATGVRRVGVLMSVADDQEGRSRLAAFRNKLEELGWVESRNLRIEVCWCDADAVRAAACVAEIAGYAPDVIFSSGPEPFMALRRATITVPIVFVQLGEPVESGMVSSLAHPDRNVTGTASFEYSIAGKWLELLKQVAPQVTRVGVLRNAATFTQPGYFRAIETAAPSLGVSVSVIDASNGGEIELSIDALARQADGLIVLPSSLTTMHHELIVSQANRHKVPAVFPYRFYAVSGGLVSYGSSVPETNRQAAVQVDRVLRGTRVSDLPVQLATKFELVINLKTAKQLGLNIPPALLARADEVIE
jgi:putative tryptophan/tyrosine transport system substrate-binding protein